jgi:hypothetical protein
MVKSIWKPLALIAALPPLKANVEWALQQLQRNRHLRHDPRFGRIG